MRRLLAWVVALDGSWYHGPGGYDESDFPWRTFETMALVYAAGGALLLALVVVALVRTHRRAQVPAPRPGQRVGKEDVRSA